MKGFKTSNFRLIFCLFSFSIIIVFFFNAVISADVFSGGRYRDSKPYVYYHSSVSDYGYTSNYNRGRSYWNTHKNVNIQMTPSVAYVKDTYSIGNTSVSGLLGQIIPYDSNGNVVSPTAYWRYVSVFMYHNQMVLQSNNSTSRVNYNAAHEIGHTIKMAHVPTPYNSVMPQGFIPIPSSLTPYDSSQINIKWP